MTNLYELDWGKDLSLETSESGWWLRNVKPQAHQKKIWWSQVILVARPCAGERSLSWVLDRCEMIVSHMAIVEVIL